jgi:YD repeat-containing protein
VIRRLAADGSLVGDTSIPWASLGVEGSTTTVSPDGRYLFEWDPQGRRLTRVDVETGESISGSAPTAAADPGLLDAIGAWLVPTVSAKMLLQTGITISPDGKRVYALGMNGNASASSGSSGIDVFDAATLTPLDHWDATADFVSIAVSGDGATVYAAGMPGVNAESFQTDQPASITAFDALTGKPRVIAGDLGTDILVFASPLAQ